MKASAEERRIEQEQQDHLRAKWGKGSTQVGPSLYPRTQPTNQGDLMEASDTTTPADEETVVGDPGLDVEPAEADQQPTGAEDSHGTHTPASAPPATAQSGVPLPEDKGEGVKPDPTDVTPPGEPEVAKTPGL